MPLTRGIILCWTTWIWMTSSYDGIRPENRCGGKNAGRTIAATMTTRHTVR